MVAAVTPPEDAGAVSSARSASAEQSVLGCLLISNAGAWNAVADLIGTADFARPDHRLIFAAIATLVGRGADVDTHTVKEYLQRAGTLDDAGGEFYLVQLGRETPTSANARTFAEFVLECSLCRDLARESHGIDRSLVDSASDGAVALIIRAESKLVQLRARAERSPLQHHGAIAGRPRRAPLNWIDLQRQELPQRAWAIEHWLPMGHVTLLAGGGGTGKTLVAQSLASCLALRREYLDWMPAPRRVLMWACEDEAEELWRRQAAIGKWLGVELSAFDGQLVIESYHGKNVELAALDQQRLIAAPMLEELRMQIGDYGAEVVILDNVARLFGGNENDRHQVTTFVQMLTAAASATGAAVLLLSHPGKAAGSEYSGTTAWEGAVRGRLYLGHHLPDAPESASDDEEGAEEETVRYLCRRKANYSNRDWRRLHYRDGVMVPEIGGEPGTSGRRPSGEVAADIVLRAVRKLLALGMHGNASRNSPAYLPRLAKQFQLLERLSEREFFQAMRDLMLAGRLRNQTVGSYANRTPKTGLVERE